MPRRNPRSVRRLVLVSSALLAAAVVSPPSASAGTSEQYVVVCSSPPYAHACVWTIGQPVVRVVPTVTGVVFLCPSVSGAVPVCQDQSHPGGNSFRQMMVVGASGVLWVGAQQSNASGYSSYYQTEVDGPAGTTVYVAEYDSAF